MAEQIEVGKEAKAGIGHLATHFSVEVGRGHRVEPHKVIADSLRFIATDQQHRIPEIVPDEVEPFNIPGRGRYKCPIAVRVLPEVTLAYLDAGDYWKQGDATRKVEDLFTAFTLLSLSF